MNVQLLLIFPLFFFSLWLCHWCRAAELSCFSTPAHILTVERVRPCSPYSCCGKTQAWIYQRDPGESLSFLLASPQFSVSTHQLVAQLSKGSAGYVAPFSYPLSPLLFVPSSAHTYLLPGWNSVRGSKRQGKWLRVLTSLCIWRSDSLVWRYLYYHLVCSTA